jgi:hypothetical protein
MTRLALILLLLALLAALFRLSGAQLSLDALHLALLIFLILAALLGLNNLLRGVPPRDVV